MENAQHVPVMMKEVVEALQCCEGGVYVDGTLGLGGYAEALLLASAGKVIGVDVDPEAIAIAQKKLERFSDRIHLVQGSYADLPQHLSALNIKAVNGICIDIGVSSLQLDRPQRGFSFRNAGPLDMRMNPDIQETAEELVNTASESDLADWFWMYGEDRFSKRIARVIVSQRQRKRIVSTVELAECVASAVPKKWQRIHPATRVFQALRIVVNQELEHLEKFLATAPTLLKPGGRVVVVSYHSLEDRLVKQAWKHWEAQGGYQIQTKRPLTPSELEVATNPRARSAKLRVLEHVAEN